jgi:hypothetical protein
VVAREVLIRRHVGAGGRSVGCSGIAHPVGNRGPGASLSPAGVIVVPLAGASRCAAARAPTSFHSRLARVLARTPPASRC